MQQLPQQVYVISEDGNTQVGKGEGNTEGADACKGKENETEEWSEGDFDAIEIDVVPGETESQRRERKKTMCKQLWQVQGKVALRKKEKAKTAVTKNVDNKQKVGKEGKE